MGELFGESGMRRVQGEGHYKGPVLAGCRDLSQLVCGSKDPAVQAKFEGSADDLTWPDNPRARNCAMLILKCSGEALRDIVTTSHTPLAPTVFQQNKSPSSEIALGSRRPGSKKSGNGQTSG